MDGISPVHPQKCLVQEAFPTYALYSNRGSRKVIFMRVPGDKGKLEGRTGKL